MPHQVLQSSTQGFYVFADDAGAYGEGLSGLSISVSLSKGGGAFNAVSPAITDLGGGVYWVAPLAAHRDTLGEIAWRFAADGAVIAPRFERVTAVNDQLAAWGVPSAVLDAAAVSPIHANIKSVDEAADVATEESVQTLLSRVTEPVATMFTWLVDMITPPAGSTGPQFSEEALARAPGGTGTGDRRQPLRAQLADDAEVGVPGVRFRVAGSTLAAETNALGDAFLDLSAGEYVVQVPTPNGYEPVADRLVTIPAEGDVETLVVDLVPLVPIEPAGPGQANLVVWCFGDSGSPAEGVVIYGRVAGAAKGSFGRAHDGAVQHELSGPDGRAVLKVPRLTRYQVRRGESPEWTTLDIGDVSTVEAPSFVGMP